MPWKDQETTVGPLAVPEGLNVNPQEDMDTSFWRVLGAGFRLENPIVSVATGASPDPLSPVDPDFRTSDEIQGTKYEQYADRFVGVFNRDELVRMQHKIDQEEEDRRTLQAAGLGGYAASFAAALTSPTILLPGGALVRGAKGGVAIGRTGLTVAGWAGLAAGIDEAVLQASQETRTPEESAFAIGGSFILGGMLGGTVGALAAREFRAASLQMEQALVHQTELNDAIRSIGAAENRPDLTLRREEVFQAINSIPVLRGFVRSDPILRAQLSPNVEARAALVELAETPLQYRVNEQGLSARQGQPSVETVIKDRERNELAKAVQYLSRSYADYAKDGPAGLVGTFTQPITVRFQNLMGRKEKLTQREFLEEVGKAMRGGDKHPIPQIQNAAEALRSQIFDKVKGEMIEAGLWDEALEVTNAPSYFMRVYNRNKIQSNLGNGGPDDLLPVLEREFLKRREIAQQNLAFDRTLDRLEAERFQLNEQMRGAARSLRRARQKAVDKRERARAAQTRQSAVGRVSGVLRKAFQGRQADLKSRLVEGEELEDLKSMLKFVRSAKRIEPDSMFQAMRQLGGVKDPRARNRWSRGDWRSDGAPTEIERILDNPAVARTIRRNDGLEADYMREALIELGYLDEGADLNAFLEAVSREAGGEKVYSRLDEQQVAKFKFAVELADELDRLGIDYTKPVDDVIRQLEGKARSPKATKAKAEEAGRSGKQAGKAEARADAGLYKAMDRLEEAMAEIRRLDEEVAPQVRDEIKAAREQLRDTLQKIDKEKKKRGAEEYYASLDDAEVKTAVDDAVRSIIGLKPGEHHAVASLVNPLRARVLDVADEVLEPWLESNVEDILGLYLRSMVPYLEMSKRGLDEVGWKARIDAIQSDGVRRSKEAKSAREKNEILAETKGRVEDLEGIRDRLLGRYGVPKNPEGFLVQAGRAARTVTYTSLLGQVAIASVPDLAGIIGRNGIEAAFGATAALTDPKRMFTAVKDMGDFGAAAEWYLNSRAMSIGEVADPYSRGTRLERGMGQLGRNFSIATGMIPWNMTWKSVGGAFAGSRFSKAAVAVLEGKATKKQLRQLAEADIEPWMAERIGRQVMEHGDRNGALWLPQARLWTDQEAVDAARRAMQREMDLMVITPGQDRPLFFSTEGGKFFTQFKAFGLSAHHRILLSGIQRADADVLAQVTMAILLGGLVSNIRADLGGYERKEGSAFWVDAIDRSGVAGWMFEVYGPAAAIVPQLAIGGETTSRFMARSTLQGMVGPSFDLVAGAAEGVTGIAGGKPTYRDVANLLRLIPGNNLWWMLNTTRQIESSIVDAIGAKPRE